MDFFDFDGDLSSPYLGLDFGLNPDLTPEGYANIEEQYNVSFGANENADGYIPDGNITLERTISGSTDSFPHYTKDGHDFVKVGGRYIQVDGGNTVTINNIKYDSV